MSRPQPSPVFVLALIAVGGALGSAARWGLAQAWPTAGGFPWATLAANVSGAAILGALLVTLDARRPFDPYLRPFLAVGVLGGYTTFSTYVLETRALWAESRPAFAILYVGATLLLGLGGCALGLWAARTTLRGRR